MDIWISLIISTVSAALSTWLLGMFKSIWVGWGSRKNATHLKKGDTMYPISRLRLLATLLLEVVIVFLLLYQVHQPGTLTKPDLFWIAFGIGAFFFLLIQTTIVSAIRGLIEPGPPPDREKSDEK